MNAKKKLVQSVLIVWSHYSFWQRTKAEEDRFIYTPPGEMPTSIHLCSITVMHRESTKIQLDIIMFFFPIWIFRIFAVTMDRNLDICNHRLVWNSLKVSLLFNNNNKETLSSFSFHRHDTTRTDEQSNSCFYCVFSLAHSLTYPLLPTTLFCFAQLSLHQQCMKKRCESVWDLM